MPEFKRSAALLAMCVLIGCTRKETVETYLDKQRKLVREYAWPGPRDSLHLRVETAYYFNGSTESVTHFRHGRLEGEFKAFWENGQLKARGGYVNGQPEDKWEYYYNDYTMAGKGAFLKGKKDGLWTEYWENGELKRRGEYRIGKQIGEWVAWNSTGGEVLRTTCFESNAEGYYRSFHDNGSVKEEYGCRRESKVGPYTQNFMEGNLQCRGFFDTAGSQDSLWVWFHPDGRPSARQKFHHGLWNDTLLAWDSLGHVIQAGYFRLGTGAWTRYDSLRHPIETKSFSKGAPVSLRRWHSNGKVSAEGVYADGKKTGVWKMWNSRTILMESAIYLDGKLHGDRRFYDSSGALMRLQKYFHGIPTKGSFPGLESGKSGGVR